jgi:threonine dehydrogenase-like Zn-dependent dehydrogenase
MPNTMSIADLDLLPEATADSQRVAVLREPFRIEMAHAAIPEPGVDEIRIQVRYVGICGSDLESYRGIRSPEFLSTPARLGHEVSGVIEKVGEQVRGLQVGQRVACRYVWGAFAEYIVCKPFNVHTVPDTLADKDISPIEVLPGILHAVERAAITPNTDVLIMGQGVSGLVMTQAAALFSPRNLVVTDLKDGNLERAKRYGATHAYKLPGPAAATMDTLREDFPHGFEAVIPCLLEGERMMDALDCCAFAGRLVLYGCIAPCTDFDWLKLHRKRVDILTTEPKRDIDMRRWFTEGVRLVEQGLINLSEMVTHTFPLSEIQEAFQQRDEGPDDSIHILIDCTR